MITKIKIAHNISKNSGISKSESYDIFNKFLDIFKKKIQDNTIKLNRFGTFTRRMSPQRIGRNPKTGESYIITKRKKVIFKPSNKVRSHIN